ncbi:hypothetical protein [Thermocrinis sp.]|uniref:hypothetical protein n=1 Tax=Thermocrinis sp. TaxID=2024383 RepID=UPI002FDE7C30
MEIRRIEGVFLQHALETSQGLRAGNVSKELNLRLLSTVPESLLQAFSESSGGLKGYVLEAYGRNLRILLNNNQEILAENMSDVEVQKGDYLELALEGKNPLSLRIISLQRKTGIDQILDIAFGPSESFLFSLEEEDIASLIRNSGLFYERKLLSHLRGEVSLKEILEDAKAQIILNLLSLAEDVQSQLNIQENNVQSLDSIKNLFLAIMNKTENLAEIRNLLRNLYLENLNNWELAQFIRFIESSGNRQILGTMERGDKDVLIHLLYREIQNLLHTPAGKSLNLAFERLKTMVFYLKDTEIKEQLNNFIKALDNGKIEDLRESHRKLVGLLEEREKLLPLRERIERDGLQWIERLNIIIQAQRIMANDGVLVVPFKWEGRKASIILRSSKDEYRVFVNLNYPEGFISAMLLYKKDLSLRFYTNSEVFYSNLETSKHILESMLKEENIKVKEIVVNLIPTLQDLKKVIKGEIHSTNLYLVV